MHIEIARDAHACGIDFSAHVFASPGFLSAKSSDYGWLVSDTFALPFFCERILAFRRLIFTDAPIAIADGGDVQAFLDAAIDAVGNARICDFIAKPQANAVFPCVPAGGISAPWGTYETRIDRSDDELLAAFHVKHRNVIRKAMRDGVEVRVMDDFVALQACLKDTLARQGLPYFPSLPLLHTLERNLKGQVIRLAAYLGDELQGVVFVPFDSGRGYYLYGGSIPAPHGGAINLLQFETMRVLRARGVKVYDFVGARIDVKTGTKYEGIQRFKSRFGAELRQGFAFRAVFNPVRFALFNALASVRLRLAGRRYIDPIDQLIRGDYE